MFEAGVNSDRISVIKNTIMFIVLDGIDGAGKGRQRSELVSTLSNNKQQIQTTDFPDHQGEIYKNVIHPALHEEISLSPQAWFLAFVLDQLMWESKIDETIGQKDKHFISDGYFTTTLAYQCKLSKVMNVEEALELADRFGVPKPDLVIFIDVDPKVAMSRKMVEDGHDEGLDIFERNITKQQKLRQAFTDLAKENIWTGWEIVDGNLTIKEVKDEIIRILNNKKLLKI